MKAYTFGEVIRIIREIDEQNAKIQNEISALRENRKVIKFWDFKSKAIIDQKVEELTIQSNCYSYSKMMLSFYEDSLHSDRCSMEDERLIRCEKEADAGDGISKLIIFCHKCFIDNTIIDRDIKLLELEAEEGNESSTYILFAYNSFFAD